jgi:hypothetical protein
MTISAVNQMPLVKTEAAERPKQQDIITRLPEVLAVKIFSYVQVGGNRLSCCDLASKSWRLLVRSDQLWAISRAKDFMLKPNEANRHFIYDRSVISAEEVLSEMELLMSSIERNQKLEVNFYSDLTREKSLAHFTLGFTSDTNDVKHIKKHFFLLQKEPDPSADSRPITSSVTSEYREYTLKFHLFGNAADRETWSCIAAKVLQKQIALEKEQPTA